MAANEITQYLLKHLWQEIPGLDLWRANRYKGQALRAGGRLGMIDAGIDGQADLTGHFGFPDYEVNRQNRRVELEVKAPGDSQNKNQTDFEHRCKTHGTLYIICTVRKRSTVEEILTLLKIKKAPFPAHPAEIAAFIKELRERLGPA